VGFFARGRTAVALSSGLGSIVTYANGATQIGSWHEGVPASGVPIESVRQNLHLLVDHGVPASTVGSCVRPCWGDTLGGGTDVARSALGITSSDQLVWAAGESLSPAELARALVGAHAQRAVELDINPFWVAGYLYVHHPGGPTAVPVVPGYGSAKAGVLALTRNLAVRWAGDGIRINAVIPGVVATLMTAPMDFAPHIKQEQLDHIPLGRFGTPAEIAAAILYLCTENASYCTGSALVVDGGYSVL